MFVFLLIFLKILLYSIERSFEFKFKNYGDLRLVDSLLSISILFDSLVTFNTKIYVSGFSVKKRSAIAWNYIKRYAIIDLAAYFGMALNIGENSNYPDLLLLLLIKLLFGQPDLANRIRDTIVNTNRSTESLYDLLSLGSKIILSAHIMACLWHFISFAHYEKSPEENSWLKDKDLINKNWSVKYLNSIYWSVTTMLTVGYGDITPKNEVEILFNILAMFFGCIMFGFSLNSIGEILKRRNKYERGFK
jgi:hypothetical protein